MYRHSLCTAVHMLAECISHQGCHNTQCDAEHTTVTMQWNSAFQQVFLRRLEIFCGLHQSRTFCK